MWMDDSNSNENVMYTGYMRAPSSAWWLLCKLLLRLSLAGCVGVWMWHAYFRHLPRLVASLEAYGLCDAPISATLEVVVGDPTAYVLLHPMVSIAFVLDFWLSVDFVARAMNRMVQATDASSFVVACVYLSRTVWFGYGTLLAMSTVLRYCRIYRPRFVAVDPTTIAILLTLAAGPITRLQSQTPALARVCNNLFTCLAPSPDEIDVGVAALVYTLIIGVLPLLLGFVLSACARARAVARQSLRRRSLSSLKEGPHVAMIHASFANNDWKNHIMTTLSIHPWTATFTCVGGSVYDLFDKQPKYSRNMALSLRGADCFVLYSTPLKAYISEPFPWHHVPMQGIPDQCDRNFTACAPTLLLALQNQSQQLGPGQVYLATDRFDLVRVSFAALPDPSDADTFYLTLPYASFYSIQQRKLFSAIARREMNASAFATTELSLFLGIAISYNAIWIAPNTQNASSDLFICAARVAFPTWWLWLKFAYRLVFGVYLLMCMWRLYFAQYATLVANLERYGIEAAAVGSTLTLVVGDPTSLILVHPRVILGFVLDFWMSADFDGRAYLRVGQVVDPLQFFVACLYLSRTLWFAYGAVVATSNLMKRCGLAKYFHGVDPTYTAIGVAVVAGPFTFVQMQIPALCKLYNTLFVALARRDDTIDISLAALVYTTLIGGLPLVFGLWPRLMFWRTRRPIQFAGGSIYTLFAKDETWKAILGVSQRSTDCYVLYDVPGNSSHQQGVRLSLTARVEKRRQLVLRDASTGTSVGHIAFEKDDSISLVQGSHGVAWIM
ncbi:hypothetical protein SDRG_16293 [Saprolegnia diclina VS20]|uniref:Uncharacterized protein n=1 Tax=Saprolegnia diclina (strain VS20) TaxID=1156394 RepID=T0PKD6_SAPDV|nr:hypothetical protein SDRG_16293 [Saprolegnia diclina VS20]EQC25844.1 hypothetical protein SDRG_16293 [Saprolegnia diclina VS20]|eukprot:XP_008620719.1 hypothetical protein SDRG_16293 [Saprolegnia diclina VS20]